MPLVTLTDLDKRFTMEAVLKLAADKSGALNQVRVDQALSDAASEVEGYLSGRYQLPLSSVPEMVERVACDIAWYYLHGQIKPEHVEKRYQRCIDWLKSVAKGEVSLGISTQGGAAVVNDSAHMVSSETVWNRNRAQGFI